MAKNILPSDDIKRSSDWISNFLMREGYHADYTLKSFLEIDKFFKEKMYLALENDNKKNFIFSISTYIGEVMRVKLNGKWIISHDAKDAEIIGISFKDDKIVYPINIVSDLMQKKYTMQEYIKNNFDIDI